MKGTKKERRQKRHLRNIEKEISHKKEAWESGKLIEENHNGGPYSPKYSEELGERLYQRIHGILLQITPDMTLPEKSEFSLLKFRLYRQKIRDYILHYPPEIPKTEAYEYLKECLETYWDTPEKLLEKL